MRFAILLHRYLGLAIGFVISLWCLSAFVMMYVQYPEYTDTERPTSLSTLDFSDCCSAETPRRIETAIGNGSLDRYRFEMLAERPVIRLYSRGYQQVLDLITGEQRFEFDSEAATRISKSFLSNLGLAGRTRYIGVVDTDQWTLYATHDAHRPLHHFAADDPAETQWYISSTTGEVVQTTTFRERFWGWLGAVTHWIYFTELRQRPAAWAQLVIWLSIASLFLTCIGIYIGISRLKRFSNGRLSPYRGWALWHHYVGLAFGLFTLTWLASGLLSMNPWGALEGRSFFLDNQRLRGGELGSVHVVDTLRLVQQQSLPPDSVQIDSSIVNGEPALISRQQGGGRILLSAHDLTPSQRGESFFDQASALLRPNAAVSNKGWLEQPDTYYYGHHQPIELPVYRVVYEDGERAYLDGLSGELSYAVDASQKWYRWLFLALHRGDFSAALRSRPIWDLLLLPLLLGVSISALTGTWLGFRRLFRRKKRQSLSD